MRSDHLNLLTALVARIEQAAGNVESRIARAGGEELKERQGNDGAVDTLITRLTTVADRLDGSPPDDEGVRPE